jgi:hypothetical protein
MSIDTILSRLEKVKKSGNHSWRAVCPAHQGKSQSLSIRERDSGKVDIHCFAECDGAHVMQAIGMTLADLYPESIKPPHSLGKKPPFNAYDVLAALADEALLIAHLGSELQEHPLKAEDRQRLFLAVKRIRTACSLVGVHRG